MFKALVSTPGTKKAGWLYIVQLMLVFWTLYTYLLKMALLPHQRQMKVISHSGKIYFNMYMYPSIQHMTIVTLHQFVALIVPSATSYCCYSKDS